jgi:hypothetical protein
MRIGTVALLLGCLAGCPDNPPPRAVDARDVTRCEHGRTDDQSFIKETWKACDDAARALIDETPGTSIRYTHKACDLGYATGCLHWLDYVYKVMPRDPEVARPELDPARKKGVELCQNGLEDFQHNEAGTARACFFAARLYEIDPIDEARAKELNLHGCELEKDPQLCAGSSPQQ